MPYIQIQFLFRTVCLYSTIFVNYIPKMTYIGILSFDARQIIHSNPISILLYCMYHQSHTVSHNICEIPYALVMVLLKPYSTFLDNSHLHPFQFGILLRAPGTNSNPTPHIMMMMSSVGRAAIFFIFMCPEANTKSYLAVMYVWDLRAFGILFDYFIRRMIFKFGVTTWKLTTFRVKGSPIRAPKPYILWIFYHNENLLLKTLDLIWHFKRAPSCQFKSNTPLYALSKCFL